MKHTIEGEFYDLIIKGARVIYSGNGGNKVRNYLIDIKGVEYSQQFASDGRTPKFLRIEDNEVVSEYYVNKREATKIFRESLAEERVMEMRAREIQQRYEQPN